MGDYAISLRNKPGSGADGTSPGFDALYSEHHKKVLLAAYQVTGNLPDAEDVLQSVFLRLMKRRERLGAGANTAGYLCKAAINASIDLLRSRAYRDGVTLNEEIHPATESADSDVIQTELRRQLRHALTVLEQPAAEVFALRYFAEFSNADIAVLLDTTPNHIAVTLHRAREQLQKIIGELDCET